jgi:hypothetical protein
MKTGKIIGYVVAGILIFFGVLFLWAAFGSQTASPAGRLLVGGLLVAVGLGIIVVVRLREPKPEQEVTIRQEIDLSGDVDLEAMQCERCGGHLGKDDVSLVQGAVMVNCPYCGATYQVVEEPKW